MAEVLLYNLNTTKGGQIEGLCAQLKVQCKHIRPEEYIEPIGVLAGLPGFTPLGFPFTGIPFEDEMIVFKEFDDNLLDRFLITYKQTGIQPVALKAGLTPTNIHWNSLQLHDELTQEHKALHKQ